MSTRTQTRLVLWPQLLVLAAGMAVVLAYILSHPSDHHRWNELALIWLLGTLLLTRRTGTSDAKGSTPARARDLHREAESENPFPRNWDAIIEVEDLGKSYRIWDHPSARLKGPFVEALAGILPRESRMRRELSKRVSRSRRDFCALRDVAFSIRKGEATGIIGRNGSGKSTLLQLIAGTLTPTTGRLWVRGRVSALLELGSGFNPDFTGRENVYLNGAIFGYSRAEMDQKFDEIAAFADIGDFIDQPLKTYSSGMMMRLAFSVAVAMQPEILIIDEALAVGDVFFTQKCFQRIREILQGGATLIFVSHDMAAVQGLCDRALLLHEGKLVFDGSPQECVSRYFNLHQPRATAVQTADGVHPPVSAETRDIVIASDVLPSAKSRHGDRSLEIVAAAVFNHQGAATWDFQLLECMTVRVLLRAHRALQLPSSGLQLHDRMGNLVFAAGTPQLRFDLPALAAGQEIVLEFRVALNLQPGVYTLSLDAAENDAADPNIGHFYDRIGGLGPISVTNNVAGAMPFYGIAQLPMEIRYG